MAAVVTACAVMLPPVGATDAVGAPRAGGKVGQQQVHTKRATARKLLRMLRRNPALIGSRRFVRMARHAELRLPVTVRLNRCLTASGTPAALICTQYAPSNDVLALNLGPTFGTKSAQLYGKIEAIGQFTSTASGAAGPMALEVPAATAGLHSSPVNVLQNDAVTSSAKSDFGCSDASGPDAPALNGPGSPAATVLRTGRIAVNTQASAGQADIFQTVGQNVSVQVNASARIWTAMRIVKELGDPHTSSPAATVGGPTSPTSIATDGEHCRQVFSGYSDLNGVKLDVVGHLRISPALTADGHLRLAVVDLTSNTSHVAVKACLQAFAWYSTQPSVASGNGTPAGATQRDPAVVANVPCNVAQQPDPSSGPIVDPIDSNGDGTATPAEGAVELAADVAISTLSAEVIVGVGISGDTPPGSVPN